MFALFNRNKKSNDNDISLFSPYLTERKKNYLDKNKRNIDSQALLVGVHITNTVEDISN